MPSDIHSASLTVEDWIMVHLLRFSRYAGEFEVPWGMTQYGIAESVGTGQDHVSRAVRRLIQKGLVAESKSRVEGVQEKRKIYSLTIDGQRAASDLHLRAEALRVHLPDTGEMTLKDALRTLGPKYSLLDIARALRPDGMIDPGVLGNRTRPSESPEAAPSAPVPRNFVGRTKELVTLRGWLEEHRMVVVLGIAGIGKTALAARLVADFKGARPVFWYRFHEWDTLRNFLTPLSEFLAQQGRRKLRTYLASKPDIDVNEVSFVLLESVRGLQAIWVLDDVHKASDDFLPCFHLLTELLEKSEGIRVILTARHLKQFYDRRHVVVRGLVAELRLGGLDEESSRALLRARNINESEHDRAFLITEGHPLALELFESGEGAAGGRGNISRYIEEEISTRLPASDKRLLRMASVFRYPVPADALLYDPEFCYETLAELVARSILRELPGEKYDIHDFVRDYFYSRMTPHERAGLHREAARYYSRDRTTRGILEFVYHSIRAGQHSDAASAVLSSGEELIAAGCAGELRRNLEELDWKNVTGHAWGDVLFLKGRTYDLVGDWDRAVEFYNEALTVADDKKKSEVHYHVGWLQQKRNRWEEAADNFRMCLELAKQSRDRRGLARAYHGLGRVLWRQGKWAAAADLCEKSIDISKDIADRGLEASARIELGRVRAAMGQYSAGEKHLRESLRLLESSPGNAEISRVYNTLAWDIFKPQGKLDEALELLHRGEEIAVESGSVRELGPIYHSLGEIWLRKGDLDLGVRYLQNALGIFQKQGDEHGKAFTYIGFGILEGLKKDRKKSLEWFLRAIDIFEVVKTPSDLAYAYLELAGTLASFGAKIKARPYAEKARKILSCLGESGADCTPKKKKKTGRK